ncbi:hypothetical protein Lesp02_44540 [Lentzea sp. NBRC 105346]|uniref:MaoC/PaaZ C-terminal domain-containing protein n=1 Tax=Lentzea sp. NBRC 105346 TaxID=3032205 RepID=UPI0024A20981|nr:MaoC/PaaZ C-terminal domain-containing protein [Lentzea sp. NBRC 105346]GLZ32266.1 hypothetical protein Lesp02_44540 [Lentzea sp. NBRC 105346]
MAELTVGPISRETLQEFASASGDPNPIHVDPAAARAAGMDDVIVHGMFSMAQLGRLLTKSFSQEAIRSFRVSFVAPVPVGAALTCRGRVVDDTKVVLTAALPDGTTVARGEALIDTQEGTRRNRVREG